MSGGRVAFAANASFGEGGQGEFLRLMVRALAAQGPGATVYSRFAPADGVAAVNIPFTGTRRAVLFHALRRLPLLRGRADLLTWLADADFDARVAAMIEPPALFDGVMGQCAETIVRVRRAGARVVLTSLNTHINHLARTLEEEHALVGGGRSFVHPEMITRALHEIAAADHIRVNSHFAKGTFIEEGVPADRVTVIHPAVDLQHFHPSTKRDDVFRVLAVSSIDARKGVHYLLEAFAAARLPNAELEIIGGTGDRWSKQLLDRYRIALPNLIVRAVDIMSTPVEDTIGRASVLVHAAIEDGYGLVIPQALASGRPVIATRSAGAAELIRDGVNGRVVEPRSAPQLAEALRQVAGDPHAWAAMCAQTRPSVEHLSYAAFGEQVSRLYTNVLNSEF